MEDDFGSGVFTWFSKIVNYSLKSVDGASKVASCFRFNSDNTSNIFNSSTDILRPLSLKVRYFIRYK